MSDTEVPDNEMADHWWEQRYGPKLDGVPVEGGRAVIDADERPDADRHLADAYRHQPEDPALIESAARLAARTTPEW